MADIDTSGIRLQGRLLGSLPHSLIRSNFYRGLPTLYLRSGPNLRGN